MNNIKSNQSYAEIVCKSRDLTRMLGELRLIEDDNVADALEIKLDGGDVSIWSAFEAIIAIHCLTNDENPQLKNFLRLTKTNILNSYYRFKRKFKRQKPNNEFPCMDPHILFLGFTEYLAVENFEGIFNKITKEGKYCPVFLTDTPHKGGLASFYNLDINSFEQKSIQLRSEYIGKDIRLKLAETRKLIENSELSSTHKFSLLKALAFVAPLVKNPIQKYISVAEWMLNNNRPSAIVSIDVADPRTRVFCLLANKLGIPVVQIQAGPINQECIEWSFCNDDLMLCHGPKIKNELRNLDFDDRKVVAVGSAKFERLAINSAKPKMSLSNRWLYPCNKKTILLITSYTGIFDTSPLLKDQHEIYNNAYYDIIAEAILCDNVMLIIKPHPLENPKNHHRLASKHNNIYVADTSENTSDLIASTDAVISFGSTATFDAIILKKAVIVINFDKFALNPQFVGKSFCLLPKNRSELSNALSQINKGDIASILAVCENARQEFLKDVSYFNSSPSEEITNAICKLIEFNVLDSGINTIKG